MARIRLSTLFWLVLFSAILISWWKDHTLQSRQLDQLQQQIQNLRQPVIML